MERCSLVLGGFFEKDAAVSDRTHLVKVLETPSPKKKENKKNKFARVSSFHWKVLETFSAIF